MAKVETFYEGLNLETKKTKKYKITLDEKKYKVERYESGGWSSGYKVILENLESQQNAKLVLETAVKEDLGNKAIVNIIKK